MHKKLFLSATVSVFFFVTSVTAGESNQPQDHRSTINQKQDHRVGEPMDNRIDSEVKQNQPNTTVNPPETDPLPRTPPARSVITPDPPTPRTTPQPNDPMPPELPFSQGIAPDVPDTTYPDATSPDDSNTPYR